VEKWFWSLKEGLCEKLATYIITTRYTETRVVIPKLCRKAGFGLKYLEGMLKSCASSEEGTRNKPGEVNLGTHMLA
jgi:hypothetical protein